MAPKPTINFSDDLLKQILKMANIKTTRELKVKAARGISMGKSKFPKEGPKVIPKPTRPIVAKPAKPKGVGKIAAVKPERPKYNYVPKGKKMAQTTSEQAAAERMANKRLRMAGDTPSKPKSAGTAKPVDVRGSIVKPPDKASMRPVKPSKGYYEGDKLRGQAKDDAARIGRGQKPPKRPKPPTAGSPAPKPKGPKPSSGGSGKATATREARTTKLQQDVDSIQARIANATSPKKKAAAELRLRNMILSAASDARKGRGKYSNTRPLSDR